MTLVYLGVAWIAGVFLGAELALWVSLALATGAGAMVVAALWQHKAASIIAMLCLAVFVGGTLRSQFIPSGDYLQQFRGPAQLKAVVVDDPEPGDRSTTLYLKATAINVNGQWQAISGRLIAYAPKYPDLAPGRDSPYYSYGDLLALNGTLETPSSSESFDYGEFLGRRGIYSFMRYADRVQLVSAGQGSLPMQWLYQARNALAQSLDRALPQPQASLAQGILLGKRSAIPESLKQQLSTTGAWHIIAISGQNLSIIAGILLSVTAWLFGRRRIAYLALTLFLVWAYAALTGMAPSVLRAAIMVTLWLAAERVGRPNSAPTSLVLAAAVMIGLDPQSMWDVGFQLSFAAMAGLIFLAPRLGSLGKQALGQREGWLASLASTTVDAFSVTLAATIFTLPIIAHNFGRVAVAGLPATLLILPALPAIIVTSAATALGGLLFGPLGQAFGWLSWLFITYMLKLVQAFSSLPLSSLQTSGFSQATVWAYYSALGALLWTTSSAHLPGPAQTAAGLKSLAARAIRIPRRYVLLPLLLLAALAWSAALAAPDQDLHVSFLDVGQGDAILIQSAGRTILIDGGPSPQALDLQLSKHLPFWQRTIDLVILSHPDQDHLAGLIDVTQHYQVGQVVEGGVGGSGDTYSEWKRLLDTKHIPQTRAQAGQRIDLGNGTRIDVLNPDLSEPVNTAIDADNYSAVLKLISGQVSFLFTGDARLEAEQELEIEGADLSSTVLKVAHHGSATSTSAEFLADVNPRLAVISVGAGNRFGHPTERVLDTLAGVQVYRTDMQGTIEMTTNGQRLWVKTDRPQ